MGFHRGCGHLPCLPWENQRFERNKHVKYKMNEITWTFLKKLFSYRRLLILEQEVLGIYCEPSGKIPNNPPHFFYGHPCQQCIEYLLMALNIFMELKKCFDYCLLCSKICIFNNFLLNIFMKLKHFIFYYERSDNKNEYTKNLQHILN